MKGRYRIFFVFLLQLGTLSILTIGSGRDRYNSGGPLQSHVLLQYSGVEQLTITDPTAGEFCSHIIVGRDISSTIVIGCSTKEIDTSNSQKVSSSEDIILQEK